MQTGAIRGNSRNDQHNDLGVQAMVVNPTFFPTSFDPHFKVFHELMPFKVQEILLVSSLYDAYIMEEDGSITTRLIHE